MFLWETEEREEQENPEWRTAYRVAGCSLQKVKVMEERWRENILDF